MLPNNDLEEVYTGIWGYNAILSFCSLTCVFFAFNHMSLLLGMVNVTGTIAIQYGLKTTLALQVLY